MATKKKIAVVIAENKLNLRIGPDKACPKIATLPAGTQVALLPVPAPLRRDGWAAVATDEIGGWVMAQYLAIGG